MGQTFELSLWMLTDWSDKKILLVTHCNAKIFDTSKNEEGQWQDWEWAVG